MPTLVRRELENLFEAEFQDIEEKLRPRVAEIVLNLQPKLLQLYKQSQSPLSDYGPSSDPPGAASASDAGLTPALSQRTGTGSGADSTPATEVGAPNTIGEFVFGDSDGFDFTTSGMGLGLTTWDGSTDLSGQFASPDAAQDLGQGLDWDYVFDQTLQPALFMPSAVDLSGTVPRGYN